MSLPQELTASDPEHIRNLYKIVRRDTYDTIPGLILYANARSGFCIIRNATTKESQEFALGENGITIVFK